MTEGSLYAGTLSPRKQDKSSAETLNCGGKVMCFIYLTCFRCSVFEYSDDWGLSGPSPVCSRMEENDGKAFYPRQQRLIAMSAITIAAPVIIMLFPSDIPV